MSVGYSPKLPLKEAERSSAPESNPTALLAAAVTFKLLYVNLERAIMNPLSHKV